MLYVSARAREREIRRLFREWNEYVNGATLAVATATAAFARQIANRNHLRAQRVRLVALTREALDRRRAERRKLREHRKHTSHQPVDPLTVQALSQLVNDVQIYPQLPANPNDLGLPPGSPYTDTEKGPWLYVQTHAVDVRGAGLLVTRYAVVLQLPKCTNVRLWRLDGWNSRGFAHPNCPTQGSLMCLRDFAPLLCDAYRDHDIVKLVTLLVDVLINGPLDSYMHSYFGEEWTRAKQARKLEAHNYQYR